MRRLGSLRKARTLRGVLCLVMTVLAASLLAASAYGASAGYPPGYTSMNPGDSFHSEWDNCVYYNFEIAENDMYKQSAYLGRSAVILTDGSWVASAENSSYVTVSYTNTTYLYSTKKGYIKNTSTTTYGAQGVVYATILCT